MPSVFATGPETPGNAAQLTPLLRKLGHVTSLSDADADALEDTVERVQVVPAKSDIIAEGAHPDTVHLILRGWAARSKLTASGLRQLTAFLVPGDFCDIHVTMLNRMDHAIVSVSECTVAYVSGAKLDRLMQTRTHLTRALWWSTLLDEAILREWVVNNGQRSAYEAIAHVLCELHVRMEMIGLASDGRFPLPLRQEDLAAAIGLTSVHANRVIQKLRADGLIEMRAKMLTIRDLDGLREAAGFDTAYFHLSPPERATAPGSASGA